MNANIDIRKTARVFDEQAFDGGGYNDDYILCKYVRNIIEIIRGMRYGTK